MEAAIHAIKDSPWLIRAAGGVVKVNEKPLETVSNEFAAVFQDFTIFPFTVLQNITVSAESSKEEENRAWEVLERLELRECIGGPPTASIRRCAGTVLQRGQSSQAGGTKSSPWHGRCLHSEGLISWMNLAPRWTLSRKSHYTIFFRKLTGQKTVIFVSHRLFSCLKCDKIFVMDHGKLVQE